ncbi:MAG: ferritin-like domain-containing protein [Acidipila sp.]|nr:ferritin-like domain-containing protein [Acidipila sp.]
MKQSMLKELYIDELKDIYSAENQLVKALPKLAKAVNSDALRTAFENHWKETKNHVARLETIFEELGESPNGKKCKGMEGLVKEGSEMIAEDLDPAELDAGLISAAQRVEHYEIAGYGCVATYARLLGEDSAASLLEQTLSEEKAADSKLTEISEVVNAIANDEEGDEEEAGGRSSKGRGKSRAARA